MFSLRYGVRRAAAVTVASALAATVFVGCSNQNESLAESVSTAEVTTADSTSEAATTVSTAEAAEDNIPDEINSGITASDSVGTGESSADDIAVIITDNRDILQSDKDARDEAERITEEREAGAHKATEDEIKAVEELEKNRLEVAASYEQAVKNNPGVRNPTDSFGNLTGPAKPVEGAQKPKGSTKFTGDKSTALVTKLPEGCVWTPTPALPNAYTDAAGNLWINNKRPSDPAKDGNRNGGYYDPDGDYHATQEEYEYAEEMWRRDQMITDMTPTGNGPVSSEDAKILDDLFGLKS